MLLETLGSFNVTALVSTAGAPVPSLVPENVHVASYLPGEDAVKMASLVICNGGSPTTHQALSQGVPVVGLPSNLDQYLNMAAIEKSGAGQCLRAGSCEAKALRSVISRVLDDAVTHAAARRLAVRFTEYDSAIEFQRIIKQIGEHPERRRQAGKD
jgi:UDP:flavonoid glycosyltransferase YjiC (YdhE family)